jgi:putative ABC transport system permease protein
VGLRVALGAAPARIGLAVLRGFGARVGVGALAGVLLVWLGAPAFVGMLDLSAARDPVPYVLVSVVLVLTALVAVAVPLRRALAVQPTEALRAD